MVKIIHQILTENQYRVANLQPARRMVGTFRWKQGREMINSRSGSGVWTASGVAVDCAIEAWRGHIKPEVFIGALVAWMTWKILTRWYLHDFRVPTPSIFEHLPARFSSRGSRFSSTIIINNNPHKRTDKKSTSRSRARNDGWSFC